MDGEGTAYGAGKAGGPFDPISFIKKPQVILRLVSLLFSIIVFGCISSQGWFKGTCLYNGDANACGFGVAIGVIAFIGLLALLAGDAMFDNISSIQQRKWLVMGDLGFSGGWTFMWFVTFCYLADAWRRSSPPPQFDRSVSGVQAAIAFSFFSIFSFGALTYFAVMRYRSGAADAFASTYEPDGMGQQGAPSPYSTYAGGETGDPYQQMPRSDPYQQPPFGGATDEKQAVPDFNAPTY